MMKRVHFYLEEQWNKESLPEAAEALRNFRGYGFASDLWVVERGDILPPPDRDTLCIADSERLLQMLAGLGAAFCAYSHPGNGSEKFGSADYVLMEPQWVDRDSLVKIWQRQRHLPWSILETARCAVREFVPEDLEAIRALYDDEALRYLEAPSQDTEKEREILKAYIDRVYRLCGYGHWAVLSLETGELIGRIGYSFPSAAAGWKTGATEPAGGASAEADRVPESAGGASAEADRVSESAGGASAPVAGAGVTPDATFGYLVRRDWRGKGIAREVCAALLEYGFEQLGFETIGADAAVANTTSDKLLRSFGFREVARSGEQRYYILNKKEWFNIL